MARRKKKKILLSPVMMMIIMILSVCVLSSILSILSVDASQTSIVNNNLETSLVVIRNIFSKEGLINFFTSIFNNFSLLKPLSLIIISLLTVSVGKSSGLFKHLFMPLKKLKPFVLTFIVVFLGVLSTVIGDYSYIVLIPFVAVMYEYLNKSPMLGVITIFLGITLGYGAGLFVNYNDYALGILTETAAVIDVDATYEYSLYSSFYIMITSSILLTFLLTYLIDKYIGRKIQVIEHYEDELVTSKKALSFSLIGFVVSLIPIVLMILPNGVLLDTTQEHYIAQLFSSNSGFYASFIYLTLIIISIVSYIYGKVSGNFQNHHDFSFGLTKEFEKNGYLFLMLFLSSILIGIIDWTNIGVVFAIKLLDLISLLDLSGIPLIIVSFIAIILMSIFIPGSIEKWALISPIIVPVFMRGNLTPDFAQFLFEMADGIGKVLTPAFIYFILLIGFIQKYNIKENKLTLLNTMKLVWPIIIIVSIVWLLLLILWYISGLPLGVGTLTTM